MAGGIGARFWPVSRRKRPKQFLPAGGGTPAKARGRKGGRPIPPEGSLIAETARRLRGLVPPGRILVVGSAGHRRLIRETLPEVPARNIVLEPEGRNTAPCLGLAAHLIEARAPGAVMAAFPADHHISRPALLRRLVRAGARLAAERDAIVTLGMEPRWAETGYGYIRRGAPVEAPGGLEAYAVRRFTEKPKAAAARRYLASGAYYWNGGIFIWRAARAVEEIARNLPATGRRLRRAAAALREGDKAAFARAFKGCQAVSIDYAVMERARGLIVLPAAIGWSDVGSWTALREVLSPDGDGNVWILPKGARVCAEGARGLIVRAEKSLVAALGVENLIVVETGDALLLCAADRAQEVGDLVKRLGAEGLARLL
ncbi:MAG: sugar phosphate nucleotidyltransferase [bacterium]